MLQAALAENEVVKSKLNEFLGSKSAVAVASPDTSMPASVFGSTPISVTQSNKKQMKPQSETDHRDTKLDSNFLTNVLQAWPTKGWPKPKTVHQLREAKSAMLDYNKIAALLEKKDDTFKCPVCGLFENENKMGFNNHLQSCRLAYIEIIDQILGNPRFKQHDDASVAPIDQTSSSSNNNKSRPIDNAVCSILATRPLSTPSTLPTPFKPSTSSIADSAYVSVPGVASAGTVSDTGSSR